MPTNSHQVVANMGLHLRSSHTGYNVPCVTHDDNKSSPSLHVSDGRDGSLLLWCFGGCSNKKDNGASFEKILAEMISRGYVSADTKVEDAPHFVLGFDERVGKFWAKFDEPGYSFEEIYPRYDRATRSDIVTFKARYTPKTFKWFKPHAEESGKWQMRKPARGEEVAPFYYPEVFLEKSEKRVLHWPEGEKDAKTLREAFGLASFSFGGVTDTIAEWFLDELVGARAVVVWADNDEAGLKAGTSRALMLWNRKIPVKLAVSPVGKDITNWKLAGLTKEQLDEFIKGLPLWVPPAEQIRAAAASGLFPSSKFDVGSEAFAGDYFAHKYSRVVKFVAPGAQPYHYCDGVWSFDEGLLHWELAKEIAPSLKRDMGAGAFDQLTLQSIDKLATKVQTYSGLKAVVSMAKSIQLLKAGVNDFDGDDTKHLFNCESGVVNMRTMEVLPHSSDFLLTKKFPTKVDFEHDPIEFIQFLRDAFKDEEIVRYMQLLLGYAFTGEGSFQRFVMMTGESGTGKSQLLSILSFLGGPYLSIIGADSLRRTKGQRSAGVDSDLAKTHHARVIVAHELSEKHQLDEPLLKALSGGDPVPVKFMGKNKFNLKADAFLIFTANDRPPLSDDSAVARRLMEIRFENIVAGTSKDVENYGEKLVSREGARIAGWLIKGAKMCYDSNFAVLKNEPKQIRTWTDDYIDESNVVKHWLHERTKSREGLHAKSSDLFDDFEKWCRRCKLHVDMSIRTFGKRLVKLGLSAGKNHIDQRGFHGICLIGD